MKIVLDISAIGLAIMAFAGCILLCQSWEIQERIGKFFGFICRIIGLVLCIISISSGWQCYRNTILSILTWIGIIIISIILFLFIITMIIIIHDKLKK